MFLKHPANDILFECCAYYLRKGFACGVNSAKKFQSHFIAEKYPGLIVHRRRASVHHFKTKDVKKLRVRIGQLRGKKVIAHLEVGIRPRKADGLLNIGDILPDNISQRDRNKTKQC